VAVGSGVEEGLGLASIVHGRLHGRNHRVGVPRDGQNASSLECEPTATWQEMNRFLWDLPCSP